jgi:hypothetical protein
MITGQLAGARGAFFYFLTNQIKHSPAAFEALHSPLTHLLRQDQDCTAMVSVMLLETSIQVTTNPFL